MLHLFHIDLVVVVVRADPLDPITSLPFSESSTLPATPSQSIIDFPCDVHEVRIRHLARKTTLAVRRCQLRLDIRARVDHSRAELCRPFIEPES